MPWVLIIHEVDDYPAWKAAFDEAAGIRRDAGEQSFQVLMHDDAPERIVHLSQWTSLTAARAFFDSPEVAAIRERAGVHPPAFHYLEELDRGVL